MTIMTPEPELYEDIHHIDSLDQATEEDLRCIIQTFPIVDNHAHNVLREEYIYNTQDYPFESITSEAQGHALHDHTHTSLAHMKGVKQLAEFLDCEATLEDVKVVREERVRKDYPEYVRECFAGTHAILIDDGLSPEAVHPISWHKQLVPTVSRLVRVEQLAAELLEQLAHTAGFMKPDGDVNWDKTRSEALLVRFNTTFRNQVRTLAQDSHVRGFKSVVCYRSGLDVQLHSRHVFRPRQSLTSSHLLSAFHDFMQQAVRTHQYRVQQKEVNDYLVVTVCDVLDKLIDTDGESIPIQFHTGLGDSDIDLIKANPALMKPLITAFPNVDFVLLHAAYPYTREAGYMASTFANVWLDIGLIFPMLSREGQESALKQSLQLTPISKILWSTDGHLHPETYYLANCQFRAAFEKVLLEYVHAGDLSISQAISAAVDILFWNSNQLYKLEEERKFPQLIKACGRSPPAVQRKLIDPSSIDESFESSATTQVELQPTAVKVSGSSGSKATHSTHSSTIMASSIDRDVAAFDSFLAENNQVRYVWVQILDYVGSTRLRMIPVAAFRKHLSSGSYPGIVSTLPSLMQDDTHPPEASATGQFLMLPDLSSLCINTTIKSPSATVQTWLMDDTDETPNNHADVCPRWALQKQVDALKSEFDLTMMMGFEIEVVFVRPYVTEDGAGFTDFKPITTVHSWSGLTHQDHDNLPMVEEIVEDLAKAGIILNQFHCEAAPGQWEFPLPASEPVKSIDTLYKARDIIRSVAKKYGLKATLYPRPYNYSCGSACHAHFSINGDNVHECQNPFLAGILDNLPSILAFSLPIDESYERIAAGIWAGGEYVTWGTQNREVPIRKCGQGHWELKTVDGIGNMYLSMAALVASGLHGLRQDLKLKHKDNLFDASELSNTEREDLGITTMLPKKLDESLSNLAKNKVLREMMGDKLVDTYVAVKRHMKQSLDAMNAEERRIWLVARY